MSEAEPKTVNLALQGGGSHGAFTWGVLDALTRMLSPYQLNPFNYNPLRGLLARQVDFARLRAASPFKLFVAATNVRSGHVRIFRESELELDMVLASACLPFAFQAVPVEDAGGVEHYWDGGYMGNPALFPLFYATTTRDLLLVQINPLRREEVPDTAQEIIERMSEISFNASLIHELRAVEFVQRLLNENKLDGRKYRSVLLHMIGATDAMRNFGASSKYNSTPDFLHDLFTMGRARAQEWLEMRYDYVGHAGTVRIAETFL